MERKTEGEKQEARKHIGKDRELFFFAELALQ